MKINNNCVKSAMCLGAASALVAFSSCNNSSTSTVSGMLSSLTGSLTTDSSGDLIASISASLDTSDYGISSLNLPVVDPSNNSIEYGSISIVPTVCSSSTCINGGEVTLSLDLTTVLNETSTSAALPNGTAFPISFASPSTKLVAVPVGTGGAKIYAAVGGGTYFVGTAIPFADLNGAGKYTPGADIFADTAFGNITSYIGVFAGSANNQTGVAVFADLSKMIATSTSGGVASTASRESAKIVATTPEKTATTTLKPNNTSEAEKDNFLYHLWKLGSEKHPTLRYE